MPVMPPLTPEQRADALLKATQVRLERADVKKRLKSGAVTLPQVIADADGNDAIAKMKVAALLAAMPGVGKVRAAQIRLREKRALKFGMQQVRVRKKHAIGLRVAEIGVVQARAFHR